MKTLLDLLPAVAFFGVYLAADIYAATIALIASLVLVVIVYRLWKKEWHKAHLVTAIVAGVLGGLTLYVRDPDFIKFKPTAVYAVFALALLASHVIGDRVLMQRLGRSVLPLPDALWRRVNFAWALFFLGCAVLNWYVAGNYSEDTWVKFKTFGFTALTMVFVFAHLPFVSRYMQPGDAQTGS